MARRRSKPHVRRRFVSGVVAEPARIHSRRRDGSMVDGRPSSREPAVLPVSDGVRHGTLVRAHSRHSSQLSMQKVVPAAMQSVTEAPPTTQPTAHWKSCGGTPARSVQML